jgi:hypothetical protein
MPHTGSIAVVGLTTGVGGAQRDELGEDRERDVPRRASADVQAGGRVDLRAQLVGDVERLDHGRAAPAAGNQAT